MIARHAGLAALTVALAASRLASQQTQPPYRDASLPAAVRADDLLGRMTLEEKFWQLFMSPGDFGQADYRQGAFGLQIPARATAREDAEHINQAQRYFVEQTRLGTPIIPFEEAAHGLTRPGATVFPAPIALAATWDTGLVERVAGAIARETRSRGIRQVLAPVLNIASDVRWGRVEETFGEDPWLVSRLGAAFVRPLAAAGVVATPKHFVANVGEGGRDSYPIDWSARRLEEDFFPPFRAALEAGAGSVMAAYNSVDGIPASQNRWLLTTILRQQWGFSGYVISDASGTAGATVLHHTEASTAAAASDALRAGLDVVFQSAPTEHAPYLDAFRSGLIPDSITDRAVGRVLRAKFALGLFDQPYQSPDSAGYWNRHPSHLELARQAAREAVVLLRNERRTLPLPKAIRSMAVIGVDATEGRLGGYSGPGAERISILEGIRQHTGSASRVTYTPGPGRSAEEYTTVPERWLTPPEAPDSPHGLRAEYFDNERLGGSPTVIRVDPAVDFHWTFNPPARGLSTNWYSVRWRGQLTIPATGVHRLGVEGNDGYRLYLDGRLVIDNWRKESYRARLVPIELAGGSTHSIQLEYYETVGNARVRLVWDTGGRRWDREIRRAVQAARASEVAIVVAGIEEGEFRDRARLGLPGHQEELIRAVAATGRPLVVILVGGSAVTMSSWVNQVDAVLMAWYPGEQGGLAVADVLFGDADPGGRLPITFPMEEGQLPLTYRHKPTGRGDDYLSLTGQPRFPFGFGLSYARFEYSGLTIRPAVIPAGDSAEVRLSLRNVGRQAGDEVVQLYVHDVLTSLARPVMQLVGFRRVHLEAGEEAEVTFHLGPQALALLDREMRWTMEPGEFDVMVGASAADIRLRRRLTVR